MTHFVGRGEERERGERGEREERGERK